jgi:MFS family permease
VLPSTFGRLSLLRRASQFRLLFLATAGSAVGTYLAAVALTLHVYDLTRSGAWVAALLVADFLPIVVIGLTLGPLIDRLQRRRLMVAADLVRAAVFCSLPFVSSPAAIVALAAVAGVATGFFRPAVYAGVPNLVPDEDDLTEANSLLSAVENASWMVGPLLGAALVATAGTSAAYLLNAATFLVSAVLVARISARGLQSETPLSRGHWRDVRDGIELVLHTPQLRTVLIVWNVVIAGNAAVNVAEVVFAKESLGAGDLGFGTLAAASGVGLLVGSLVTPFVVGTVSMRLLYGASIALMAVGWGSAAAAPTLWAAVPLVVVGTTGNGIALVCNQVLIQRGAPDKLRGRAVAVLMSSTYATLAVAMAAAGPLTNVLGARAMWALAGCIYLAAALVALALSRRLRSQEVEPPQPSPDAGRMGEPIEIAAKS